MSDITALMKAHGFTRAANPHQPEGFTIQTFSRGNSKGIVLANFATKLSNGKSYVSLSVHTGENWMEDPIILTEPNKYFNTELQRGVVERRVARFVRKLG